MFLFPKSIDASGCRQTDYFAYALDPGREYELVKIIHPLAAHLCEKAQHAQSHLFVNFNVDLLQFPRRMPKAAGVIIDVAAVDSAVVKP
jgi:hypothetical protein